MWIARTFVPHNFRATLPQMYKKLQNTEHIKNEKAICCVEIELRRNENQISIEMAVQWRWSLFLCLFHSNVIINTIY